MNASGTTLDSRLISWRWRVFFSTYLCYFGMYFCRKPFYVAKAGLGEHFHLTATSLGLLETAYLLAYTVGQFAAGGIGNRVGPRVTLIFGMIASILANLAFGVTDVFVLFVIAMVVNGIGQATGWSGGVGTMGNWFHKRERGTWMGWWATNYQFGGFAATFLASWLLGHYGVSASFFGGAAVLVAILLFFVPNQRNRPEDVGLPPVEDPVDVDESGAAAERLGDEPAREIAVSDETGWSRDAIVTVLLVGTFYFFVKFIRYALWSWVPYFLKLNYAQSAEASGYLSTLFRLRRNPRRDRGRVALGPVLPVAAHHRELSLSARPDRFVPGHVETGRHLARGVRRGAAADRLHALRAGRAHDGRRRDRGRLARERHPGRGHHQRHGPGGRGGSGARDRQALRQAGRSARANLPLAGGLGGDGDALARRRPDPQPAREVRAVVSAPPRKPCRPGDGGWNPRRYDAFRSAGGSVPPRRELAASVPVSIDARFGPEVA
ncbi:MAG: MFS transporter [Deltaproteobacteria bacterium]|nr:MFS transporter [Deltaproteobacteria bacterium]